MHKPDTRGTFAGQDGEYDTFLADGRVLAEGQAYNERNAQLVEDDLKAIASQIAG
jgi:ribosome-associated protein YbcJ (S4-like RNA binding protein)